jgi:RNA polymerase sigma factor (sigma-70 family)
MQLMLSVREGVIANLAPLFERYHLKLYNYFVRLTGNRQLSEDMVQEVFLRIMKYRHTFRGEGQFTTWMFSIARNVRTDHWRRWNPEQPLIEDEDEITSDAFTGRDDHPESTYDLSLLQDALLKISADQREALILSRYQGLKYTEIAEIAGCSVETVKSRVHRGIRELRSLFFQLAGERRE